jgi:hypothetical protein
MLPATEAGWIVSCNEHGWRRDAEIERLRAAYEDVLSASAKSLGDYLKAKADNGRLRETNARLRRRTDRELALVALAEKFQAKMWAARRALQPSHRALLRCLDQYEEFYGPQPHGPLHATICEALGIDPDPSKRPSGWRSRVRAGGAERPAKSLVRQNAEADPTYAPHCLACSSNDRMTKIAPMHWRCTACGAVHDERDGGAG